MNTIIVIIIITLAYFVIVSAKEKETSEAVERERRISNKKIADVYYQNMVQNELYKQNILKEIQNNFIIELENEDYIKKARIENGILEIQLNHFFDNDDEAQFFAENLLQSLNETTGINQINVFDYDGFAIATTSR